MATTTPIATQSKANGLSTALNTIFAPRAAFAQLAVTPMWGWAALIGIVLILVTTFVAMPEQLRLASIEQLKAIANMPADQQAQARQNIANFGVVAKVITVVIVLIVPWVFWAVSAVVNLIGAAASGAEAKFNLAWVVAVNASVIAFIGGLVNGIILALRGPDSVTGPADMQAVPNLGMLFPGNVKLDAFLAAFGIFYVWSYIVAVIGLEQTMKMKRGAAIATVVIYAILAGGFGALFAR